MGIYLGGYAIVEAKTAEEAVDKLWNHRDFSKYLQGKNDKETMVDNALAIVKEVEVLWDGNY